MTHLSALARGLALVALLSAPGAMTMPGSPQSLWGTLLTPAAAAGQLDPLFVNLTSDQPHRLQMALSFAKQQQALGHPVTIFLNDRGVLLGSKTKASEFGEQQALIAELLASGGTVLICPLCMNHYGIKKTELLNSLKVGNPSITGAALFGQGTQTLSW